MIDFLNLKETNNVCECVKLAHSMQLLPNQVNPYVLYIGNNYSTLNSINIYNVYGDIIPLISFTFDNGYLYLSGFTYDDINNVVLELNFTSFSIPLVDYTLYSDPIKISSYKQCKTTRVNFKCLDTDIMQSISFPFWYIQDKRSVELESAYQISVKNQMSYATANAKYKVYKTSFMSVDTINKLSDALIMPWVYFNGKRVNLYDAIEIPEVQADERFGETTINISMYKGINNEDLSNDIFVLGSKSEDIIIQDGDKNIIATDGY